MTQELSVVADLLIGSDSCMKKGCISPRGEEEGQELLKNNPNMLAKGSLK